MPPGDLLDELILDPVRILKFIDQHVTEELLVGLQNLGKLPEKDRDEVEEVSEVEGIVSSGGPPGIADRSGPPSSERY